MNLEHSKSTVWKMFNQISQPYDRTNRLLSLGMDLYWRKKISHFYPIKTRYAYLIAQQERVIKFLHS